MDSRRSATLYGVPLKHLSLVTVWLVKTRHVGGELMHQVVNIPEFGSDIGILDNSFLLSRGAD